MSLALKVEKGISEEFKTCFGRFLALRGLQGPLKASNGSQWTAQCAMRSQDKIFYYGMISLWGKLGVAHVKGGKWNI